MQEWVNLSIENIGEVIGGGTPSTKNPSFYNGDIPWITPKDLTNHPSRWISRGERNITIEGLKNSSARLLPTGTVLMTSRAPIGYLAIALNPVSTNQGFKSIVVNENIADTSFVYYLLKSNIELIKSYGIGTTFAEISGSSFKNLRFNLPPLPLQQRIAEILGALDDKIELNRQINNTREQIAQAHYKHYFVDDIDPDNLPEGWKNSVLGDHLESVSKTHKFPNPRVIFLNTSDILEGFVINVDYYDVESLPGQAKKSIKKHDILYSEIRPGNKRYAYINFDADEYVVSTKLMVLRPKNEIDSIFFFFLLTRPNLIKDLQNLAEARSGTFPQITYDQINEIQFVLPDTNFLNSFIETVLKPSYQLVYSIYEESKRLIEIREALLPKLISGDIIPADLQTIEQTL